MKNIILLILIFIASQGYAQLVYNNGDTIYIGNGAVLYVNGSIQNLDNGANNAYIRNEGTLQLTGDLTKSPNQIYTGNDSLVLSGAGTQNIAGLNYWYFGITGGGATTLTGNTTINKQLNILSGTLNTGIYTATLDSQATLNESEANYATGKLQMTKYLQKGITDTLGGLGISIKAGSANPGMTTIVRTTGSHLTGNGYASIQRYFTVTPANTAVSGSTIKFHYFDHELNSIAENDMAIYRRKSTGKWEYDGFSTRNSTIDIITASVDTLGILTAGSISNPLPVELLDFEVRLLNPTAAELNWSTASELNNDRFDIERSEDGYDFTKIGEVKGHGTTNTFISYKYQDNFGAVTTNALYYRLRQVDFNGRYAYSEIRKLELGGKQEDKLKAWYNGENEKTEALIYYEKETRASLRMIDMQGKEIALQQVVLPQGQSHISMDMAGLAKGIYLLSVGDENGVEVKKIFKR